MDSILLQKIIDGRIEIDKYRRDRIELSSNKKSNYRKKHIELELELLNSIRKLGFIDISDFVSKNEELVVEELNTKYKVIGFCNKCGKCCSNINCKYYKDGFCSIYENRPDECKMYPRVIDFIKNYVPSSCSYTLNDTGYNLNLDIYWSDLEYACRYS